MSNYDDCPETDLKRTFHSMYIVAIGWLFVVVCMTAAEATDGSWPGALATLLFYGVLPLALFLWLFGTPQRRRNRDGSKPPLAGASFTPRSERPRGGDDDSVG